MPQSNHAIGAANWGEFIGQSDLVEKIMVECDAVLFGDVADDAINVLPHLLMEAFPGAGKGHPPSTPVLTPSGWSTIGELKLGDEVIGSNGQPTRVTGVYDRGVLPTYTLNFTDGTWVECDPDHLWATFSRGRRNKMKVRSTKELANLKLHTNNGTTVYSIPIVEPVHFNAQPISITPYLLGILLANGSLDSGIITTNDVDVIDLAVQVEKAIIKEVAPSTARRWQAHKVRGALRKYGLFGVKSAQKFIPAEYMYNSIEVRRAVLAGLMDCDGSHDGRHVRYHTTSVTLRNQVVELVQSLGGIASFGIPDTRGENPAWTVSINLPHNPFRGCMKKAVKFRPGRAPYRGITSVLPNAIPTPIRCIKVEASDSLYVTQNYLVTHNTTLAGLIARHIGSNLVELPMPIDSKVLAKTVTELEVGDILFIDEVHLATTKQQESLLTLLEQGFYQMSGGGRLEIPFLTVIAATTKPMLLDDAFKDRFMLQPKFSPYTVEEMIGIVKVMASKVDVDLSDKVLNALGRASAGTPRNARRLVLAASSLYRGRGITPSLDEILHHAGVTHDGLSDKQVAYLKALKRFDGTAGASKIASVMQVNPGSLPQIERYMFEAGLIDYTDKGRTLTASGHRRIKEL